MLSQPSNLCLGIVSQETTMPGCGSGAVFGECSLAKLRCGHLSLSRNSVATCYGYRSYITGRTLSMSLRNTERPENYLLYGYFVYNVLKRKDISLPFSGFRLMGFQSILSAFLSAGTAPYISFDNSTSDEQLAGSAADSEEKIPANRTLKLLLGSCYLPHPEKEETGVEDADFICVDEQAIGVADGVGGWADLGVDVGQYARERMSNSVTAIREEPKRLVDHARVLEKAHLSIKVKGSSTTCIVALTDQGLYAINLGDGGFMVVRDGCTVFRSLAQQNVLF